MRPRNGWDPGVCRGGDGRGKRAHLWVARTAVPASDARPGGGSSGTRQPCADGGGAVGLSPERRPRLGRGSSPPGPRHTHRGRVMVAVPLGARRHLILAVSTSSLEKRLLPIFEIQSFVSCRRLGESFVKLQSKSLLRQTGSKRPLLACGSFHFLYGDL